MVNYQIIVRWKGTNRSALISEKTQKFTFPKSFQTTTDWLFYVCLDSKTVSILIEAVFQTLPMLYLPFIVYTCMWPRTAKIAEPQSKIRPCNGGVISPSWFFFTDYFISIIFMFISQFPANKITEIDLEVCEKAKFRAPFLRLLVRFSQNCSFIVFRLSKVHNFPTECMMDKFFSPLKSSRVAFSYDTNNNFFISGTFLWVLSCWVTYWFKESKHTHRSSFANITVVAPSLLCSYKEIIASCTILWSTTQRQRIHSRVNASYWR